MADQRTFNDRLASLISQLSSKLQRPDAVVPMWERPTAHQVTQAKCWLHEEGILTWSMQSGIITPAEQLTLCRALTNWEQLGRDPRHIGYSVMNVLFVIKRRCASMPFDRSRFAEYTFLENCFPRERQVRERRRRMQGRREAHTFAEYAG